MSEYHDYAWELLYHFNCAECKNWWSYTTTESRYDWKEQEMSCPLCGHRARIKPKDIDAGFPIVRNTRPGYPLPPESEQNVVVDTTKPLTTEEKVRFIANEQYHESNERDDFARTKVFSDGRGGYYEQIEGKIIRYR